MDDDDKNFHLGWFQKLEKKIEGVQTHQKKTCDELDEVDKKVVQLGADLNNHLENVKKEESDKIMQQRSKRERTSLIFGGIGVAVALISVMWGILN